MTEKALLVSDDGHSLEVLSLALRKEPFLLVGVRSAEAARSTMAREPIDVVVVDEAVAEANALEFVAELARLHPHVPRLFLAGKAELNTLLALVNNGQVYRVLRK